jgi:hypothetical protein
VEAGVAHDGKALIKSALSSSQVLGDITAAATRQTLQQTCLEEYRLITFWSDWDNVSQLTSLKLSSIPMEASSWVPLLRGQYVMHGTSDGSVSGWS